MPTDDPSTDALPAQGGQPSWVVPFWMLVAVTVAFLAGCVCGSTVTWLSTLGPLGHGDGPAPAVD